MILVISGPSSVGKTKVSKLLEKMFQGYKRVISYTTRERRNDEQEGVDYYFVNKATFYSMIRRGEFYSWKQSEYGYYGTSIDEIRSICTDDSDTVAIMDLDVDSYLRVKNIAKDAIGVFFLPPSIKTIQDRIQERGVARGVHNKIQENIRIRTAIDMTRYLYCYDYILQNAIEADTAQLIHVICNSKKIKCNGQLLIDKWRFDLDNYYIEEREEEEQ